MSVVADPSESTSELPVVPRPARGRREGHRNWTQVPWWTAAIVVLLLFTQFVVPSVAAKGQRGTSGAYLFLGLVEGLRTALIAVSMVLVYRAIRVINFAAVALRGASALWLLYKTPYPAKVPLLAPIPIWTFMAGLLRG